MSAQILESSIRHRVSFAPDPNNKAFPTKPAFVKTRLVREIAEFPEGVDYINFDSVVETRLVFPGFKPPDDEFLTVESQPFKRVFFHVTRDPTIASGFRSGRSLVEVAVHPNLKDKIWVFGGPDLARRQNAA